MRLAGFESFAVIARHVTRVGRGEERPLAPMPSEFSFAPNYTISPQACWKALNRSIDREPKLSTEKLRTLSLKRCELLFLALQPGIHAGDPKTIIAAVRVLEHLSNLSGIKTSSSHTILPETEKPKESAPPNEAIVSLFQSALETLIACGARSRNYPEIADERGFLDVTPTASDRDEDNRKNDEFEAK